MKKMIYKIGAILALWLVLTNQVFSQQVETPYLHIPGTISQEAQAFLRALPEDNWLPINREDIDLDMLLRMYTPRVEDLKNWSTPKAELVKGE